VAGKSGKFTVLILVIAAFAAAACSSPAGGIGPGVPQARVYEGLVVEYKYSAYNWGQRFYRDDLTPSIVKSNGEWRPLQPGEYAVVVIENLDRPQDESPEVTAAGYIFKTPGEKAIKVRYIYNNYLTVQYVVTVRPPGQTGNQGSGIIVKWED
jgi:hypothetical protein